ncbi:MAG: sulfite reductase subunit alpha [Pseudomonadota bacterium]
MATFLPDNAPFTPEQRAWLNGFIAGLLGHGEAAAQPAATAPAPADDDGNFPWHDPSLPLVERMKLAGGRPHRRVLMAAMGQLDCGQCGYLCKEYAEAIADGTEKDLTRCVPGGKETAKKLQELVAAAGAAPSPAAAAAAPQPKAPPPGAEPGYHRDLPLLAALADSTPLTAPDSGKCVHHVVLRLPEGLAYEPGDSLGVWAQNNPEEVEIILGWLDARGSEPVTLADGAVVSAREALTRECDLRVPTAALYWTLAKFARSAREAKALRRLADDDADALRLGIHEVLNALSRFPSARPPVAELVTALGKLQPRLYSIASSPRAHPGEVHLTVALVSYDLFGRDFRGLASGHFAERLAPGRKVPVFVQRAHGFRLPADPAVPVIMVGPGTGIAPFRAFLEERAATGAGGANWLFFGCQSRERDFLYRDELQGHVERGVLSRLDTAFSREQEPKVYVQHRMRERAAELWRWLDAGAHFYVCGDARRMAADVERALLDIAAAQGGMSAAAAKSWLAGLAKAGRYLKDVY